MGFYVKKEYMFHCSNETIKSIAKQMTKNKNFPCKLIIDFSKYEDICFKKIVCFNNCKKYYSTGKLEIDMTQLVLNSNDGEKILNLSCIIHENINEYYKNLKRYLELWLQNIEIIIYVNNKEQILNMDDFIIKIIPNKITYVSPITPTEI